MFIEKSGTPLVIQCLGLYPSTKGGTSLAPGQGTKIPGAVHHGKRKKKEGNKNQNPDQSQCHAKPHWSQRPEEKSATVIPS